VEQNDTHVITPSASAEVMVKETLVEVAKSEELGVNARPLTVTVATLNSSFALIVAVMVSPTRARDELKEFNETMETDATGAD
jgi:hypothetical protein